ncbi:hypothetical protein QMK19_03600 [Streptomyces sp. H10-C2]|uniref:hypothetical protein n=1 Tax=unclassified Streptomyces TaxID=2593676 RepID=UPI0024B8EA2B|nr:MULTISPECIES: hypothetical protein [unclassified Streptomyces]MDJ0342272.1 hypothetical protein [Streptomyces sp. PH10-H1]MDJ0368786.1 hypothetical protein [Streptomyces sp. H10-C2]
MSVKLHVSIELLDDVGAERFEGYLSMFGATVIDRRQSDHPFQQIYELDVPGAPPGAVTIDPTFCSHRDGTVSVQSLGWLDVHGRSIKAEASDA